MTAREDQTFIPFLRIYHHHWRRT